MRSDSPTFVITSGESRSHPPAIRNPQGLEIPSLCRVTMNMLVLVDISYYDNKTHARKLTNAIRIILII